MGKMRRSGWLVLGAIVALLFLFGGRLAQLAVDWLWFEEMGQQHVLVTRWSAQVLLGLVVGALLFAAIYLNVWLARRATPPLTPRFDDIPVGARVRRLARAGLNWGLALAAAAFAGMGAVVAATQWELFLLFRHAVPFGTRDPLFQKDIGFYVFTFPFWRFAYGWIFFALLAAAAAAGLVYYADRAIDLRQGYTRVAVSARVHLSVLLGLLALAKAWGYRLDAYQLLFSVSGALVGAGYTDVHARLLALNLLSVLAVVAGIGFLLNAHYRALWLPGAAIGLMLVAWLLVGVTYPGLVQQIRVRPNELAMEAPFIRRHIDATRAAYGLDAVEVEPFTPRGSLTAAELQANGPTLQNIRLWDYRPLRDTYQQLQGLYTYYRFHNVDIDRYTLHGRYRQVMLAVRELYPRALPPNAQTWVLKRLVYTHGYGIVMSPVNAADAAGRPIFFARDMPQESHPDLKLTRPQIYFGEGTEEWVVVGSREREFDHPAGEESRTSRYEGRMGIGIGSRLRRLLFAYYLGDATLLVSNALLPESRVLIRREVGERAQTLAPFLQYDNDPYAVVADGRVFWVQDAYTVSASYPYSAPFPMAESQFMGGKYAALSDQLRRGFNYIRNSVKVVTDAYEGRVRFYVSDPQDPVLRAYSGIFPGLFLPLEEMPDTLRRHLRYPEDLLRVQAVLYSLYHTVDPAVFYGRTDAWSIPRESLTQTAEPATPLPLPPGAEIRGAAASFMEPYYVIMRLPGQEREEFLLMLPFTYRQRPNMAAWLAARCDSPGYGRLQVYVFPQGVQREGPAQVESLIDQDPQIAPQLTLWNQSGSQVRWGNLLVIPIAESILYVRPLYLVAARAGIPELKRVVLVYQGRVVMEPTLDTALGALFGAAPASSPAEEGAERRAAPDPAAARMRELASQARRAMDEAIAAQRRGDWAGYGAAQKRLEDAVRALERLAAGR
jgi:uncharacterized membrane protein (UPF0182 family)